MFPSEHERLWKEGKYWKSWPVLKTFTDLKSGLLLTCTQRIFLHNVTGCVFTVEQVHPAAQTTLRVP